ncbi:MAG: hypothetical protein QXJ50_00830, partial [Candidatus Woesearchaeota archaeon]
QSCLDLTARNAVWLLGRYGGYIYPSPLNSIETEIGTVTYDYEYQSFIDFPPKMSYLPTTDEMEYQISAYTSNKILECVNLAQFKQMGYSIRTEIPKAEAVLGEKNVVINLNFPITIEKEGKEIQLQPNYKSVVNARLKQARIRAEEIINAVQLSDMEGDSALIGEISKDLYNSPKFSINFVFYIPTTSIPKADMLPFAIKTESEASKMEVSYSFLPDHLSTLWIIKDKEAKPEYWFIFATKHRKVIE